MTNNTYTHCLNQNSQNFQYFQNTRIFPQASQKMRAYHSVKFSNSENFGSDKKEKIMKNCKLERSMAHPALRAPLSLSEPEFIEFTGFSEYSVKFSNSENSGSDKFFYLIPYAHCQPHLRCDIQAYP